MPNWTKPTSPVLQSGNPQAASLSRFFLGNEGSGGTYHDVIGTGSTDLAIMRGTAAMTSPQLALAWNAGGSPDSTYGKFLSFNISGLTVDNCIGPDTGLPIGTADRGFAIIFRDEADDPGTVVAYGDPTTPGNGIIGVGLGGSSPQDFWQATTFAANRLSTTRLSDSAFHRCYAWSSGGTWFFNVDGTNCGSGTIAAQNTVLLGALGLVIGHLNNVSQFRGHLVALKMHNRAYVAGDITAWETGDWYQEIRPGATSLTPSSATIAVGATQLYTPSGIPGSILWSSSSPGVATIPAGPGATQTATAVAPGTTTIGATDGTNGASATLNVVPAAPTGLTPTAGNARVDLAWTAGGGDTTYEVWGGNSSGGETLVASGVSATTYADTGLTNGVPRFYKVKASNGGGSAFSSEVTSTPTAMPSLTPTTLSLPVGGTSTITAGGFTGGSVTWATANGAIVSVVGGVVTGVAAGGPVNVTATGVTNPAQTAICAVTVVNTLPFTADVPGVATGSTCVISMFVASTGVSYPWTLLSAVDFGLSSDNIYSITGSLPATADLIGKAVFSDGTVVSLRWIVAEQPASIVAAIVALGFDGTIAAPATAGANTIKLPASEAGSSPVGSLLFLQAGTSRQTVSVTGWAPGTQVATISPPLGFNLTTSSQYSYVGGSGGMESTPGYGSWNMRQTVQATAAFLLGVRMGSPAAGTAGTVTLTGAGGYGSFHVDTNGNIDSNSITPPA